MRTNKISSNSKLLRIALGVLIIHLFALSAFCIPKIPKIKRHKIKVHTTIVEKKQKKSLPIKEQKVKTAIKPQKKKTNKIANPKLQKKLVKAQNNFTKDLEKYFKDFESEEYTQQKTSSLLVPSKIDKLTIQTTPLEDTLADEYEKVLISYLQENLELPSFGTAKIKISISPDGKLKNLEILRSENSENIQYLKNQLHSLIYPCFNCSKEAKNFIINFSNLE
ncbi:MAG: hypothetical protein COT84_07770 [Chlamydiae bacterium CG10_big_fil_rev_8_21_14_0_10_35_9]|nr:MAG: hypothetical protein COT84_07770 [Chlamydiae bacterium CG10_big_fil_rev_8_21_14_0_10_35_9]